MRGNSENQGNVVSLFNNRSATPGTTEQMVETQQAAEDENLSFGEIMRRNAENRERMRKERLKANQSVLRSYRIKN